MPINRRKALAWGLSALGLAATGVGAGWYALRPVDTVGAVDFRNPLTIPPLAVKQEMDAMRGNRMGCNDRYGRDVGDFRSRP